MLKSDCSWEKSDQSSMALIQLPFDKYILGRIFHSCYFMKQCIFLTQIIMQFYYHRKDKDSNSIVKSSLFNLHATKTCTLKHHGRISNKLVAFYSYSHLATCQKNFSTKVNWFIFSDALKLQEKSQLYKI